MHLFKKVQLSTLHVIDEQHRFGTLPVPNSSRRMVVFRISSMTATPIRELLHSPLAI
jgi:RecG-like helicase